MVLAILDGKKTMTRRVCKTQSIIGIESCHFSETGFAFTDENNLCSCVPVKCPYGQVGDRLWVRETWAQDEPQVIYRADYNGDKPPSGKWKPSIFMPRWASRITLEITNIRVERLQEITGKDIIKEGAVLRAHDDDFGHNPLSAFDGKVYLDLVSLWAPGWDKINGKTYPWASNCWVWVIEFKMVKP